MMAKSPNFGLVSEVVLIGNGFMPQIASFIP